jgi:transposase
VLPLPRGEEHVKESQRFSTASLLAAKEVKVKVVYARCAGLDVHKKSVNVCIRQGKGNKVELVRGLFGTCTEELERMRAFLREHKVHRVVMESTGVYFALSSALFGRVQVPLALG